MSSFISFRCEVRVGMARPSGRAGSRSPSRWRTDSRPKAVPVGDGQGRQAGAKGTCGPYPPAVSTALLVEIGYAANGAIDGDRPGALTRGGISTLRCPQRMPQNAVAALECVPVISAPSVGLPPSLATLSVVASIPGTSWHRLPLSRQHKEATTGLIRSRNEATHFEHPKGPDRILPFSKK